MRPDELANRSQIELENKFKGNIRKGASAVVTALGTAVGFGTGAIPSAIEKISPFLSKYIPLDLAMKGINKINPKVGDFLRRGQEAGLNIKDGFDFLKEKIEDSMEADAAKEPAKQNKNIIEQESPELHTFIDQEIRKGRQPIEAAAIAQNDKKFANVIKKLTKAHNTPWSQIIQSIYGTGEMAQPNSGQAQQQQQVQQPQAGQGLDPGVAQILQQGAELLKRFRGPQ